MKTYLTSIILTSVLIALSELILPQGKLKTVVNTVFSITLLITMISPLDITISEESIPIFNQQTENIDYFNEQVGSFFDRKTEEFYEANYMSILKENDLIAERIEVEICKMNIDKIQIFLSNLVIPENNAYK